MKKLRRIRYYKNKNIILIFLLIVSITVGYAAIQTKLNINGTLSVVLTRWDFDYTGGEQVFTVPETGIYKLEAWGAQGANVGDSEAGYGGYSTGEIYLTKNEKLYINVGGTGSTAEGNHSYCTQDAIVVLGGYNGGGTAFAGSQDVGSGGGATHIALISGTLASIGYENFVTYNKGLIVAGGGGGGSLNGSGGGISGVSGSTASPGVYRFYSLGGTQTSGGGNYNCVGECSLSPAGIYDGVFGQGGDGNNSGGCSGSGGGGGFYGGGGSGRGHDGPGGGSGYIGNYLLSSKVMYCFGCEESSDEATKTVRTANISSQPISQYAKQGNGYARITLLSLSSELSSLNHILTFNANGGNVVQNNKTVKYMQTYGELPIPTKSGYNFLGWYTKLDGGTLITSTSYHNINKDITLYAHWGIIYNFLYNGTDGSDGSEQLFKVPLTGKYKIELWGAQGGEYGYPAGLGGYTSGIINLEKDKNLYIYVGGAGIGHHDNTLSPGGYNGGSSSGGAADWGNSSGGGATDIRLVNGNWNSFDSLKSRIMVAAGGAGSDTSNTAGSGGGLQGYDAGVVNDSQGYATGATQTRGGEYIGIYAGKIGYFGYAGYHNNDNGGGSGGYYGGVTGVGYRRSGSGGSSFISGHVGCDAILESSIESSISHTNQSIHYSGLMFLNTEMIDGAGHRWTHKKLGYVGQIQPDGTITAGHSGNGYARITYLGN